MSTWEGPPSIKNTRRSTGGEVRLRTVKGDAEASLDNAEKQVRKSHCTGLKHRPTREWSGEILQCITVFSLGKESFRVYQYMGQTDQFAHSYPRAFV